ncbi:MAG: nitroreductase family protein [Spirochaetia bacterium]|jgi:nitroreductase
MMSYTKPVTVIIRERFSCREYSPAQIGIKELRSLHDAAAAIVSGPCGTPLRFRLIAATEENANALRGLGTYGFIKSPAAFIVGAAAANPSTNPRDTAARTSAANPSSTSAANLPLEDYGYALEQLVLTATDLGLGSCWLGGFFTRSSFARAVELKPGEVLPAVASLGVIADLEEARNGMLRRRIGGDRRLGWEELFFDGRLGVPLGRAEAGNFCGPLDMVRLAPSASNKQPWRIVKEGRAWHFYLQRNRGYGKGLASRLLKVEDIQRVDTGIAMCHFELAAQERFHFGSWAVLPRQREATDLTAEYVVSWKET